MWQLINIFLKKKLNKDIIWNNSAFKCPNVFELWTCIILDVSNEVEIQLKTLFYSK